MKADLQFFLCFETPESALNRFTWLLFAQCFHSAFVKNRRINAALHAMVLCGLHLREFARSHHLRNVPNTAVKANFAIDSKTDRSFVCYRV